VSVRTGHRAAGRAGTGAAEVTGKATRRPWTGALASGVLCLLAACSETSLNEAPVVDLSSRGGTPPAVVHGPATGATAVEGSEDTYTVQKGDTLFRIAMNFHCALKDLARWNGIEESTPIFIGQRLRVRPPVQPAFAAPAPAAAAAPVAPPEAEASAVALPVNESVETRALAAPPAAVAAAAEAAAPAAPTPAAGTSAAPAAATAPPAATAGSEAPAGAPGAGASWVWPVPGRVTAQFDPAHRKGIEIGVPDPTQVVAVADGEVSYTGSLREYGNLVIVRHSDELRTVYAHLKTIQVHQGQAIVRGQPIAIAGKTGSAETPFHFEVRRKGMPVNPLDYLPAR
jgi:lipoprotein NlpD